MMKRREFCKSVAATFGAICQVGRVSYAGIRGANGDVRLGFVGLQRRGPQLIRFFKDVPGVRITAICDCDSEFLDREAKKFHDVGSAVQKYVDYRHLLADKNVDAVVLATPDHWHALMTVEACQHGKDVYVEKPVSHNIEEGRKMVQAARKYRCIVQAGTQERSDVGLTAAAEYMGSGALGRIRMARAYCRPFKRSIGRADGSQKIPPTCNYDLYQGPAPMKPLTRRRLHYDWHFFWDTGTGDTGNRGVHVLDDTWWMTGCKGLPEHTIAVGGRFEWNDDGETPNTQIAYFDTKPVPIMLQLLSLPVEKSLKPPPAFGRIPGTLLFECEGGYVAARRGGATAYDEQGQVLREFPGDSGRGHYANFVKTVRSRKTSELKADIGESRLTTALCHLANISHRSGALAAPDDIAAATTTPEVLAQEVEQLLEHLRSNHIRPGQDRLTLGRMLDFNPQRENFTGKDSDRVNALLKRQYRAPYVMPKEV